VQGPPRSAVGEIEIEDLVPGQLGEAALGGGPAGAEGLGDLGGAHRRRRRGDDLEEAIALADKVVVITAGPGTVKAKFAIDLPRPRVVQEIRFDPTFTRLYGQIWEALRDEVDEAYDRTTTLSRAAS
jgi:hypothetical protein